MHAAQRRVAPICVFFATLGEPFPTPATADLHDPRVYRDLSKPMGALDAARAREFRERYEAWEDPSGHIPKFHYGTHYSSAAIVVYYLIRLEPFTRIHLQLQAGKFDHADRLFCDVGATWASASAAGGMSDVKELIPEFYYLPELFENSNRFDMGEHQKGGVADAVRLPPWAHGEPAVFVRLMRKALESPHVSAHLHEWLDLIFGCKQKGGEAVDAQNVFYYLTYEDVVDIDKISDPTERAATVAQINNFGQTPHQLFKKPHPRRLVSAPQVSLLSHTSLLRSVPPGSANLPKLQYTSPSNSPIVLLAHSGAASSSSSSSSSSSGSSSSSSSASSSSSSSAEIVFHNGYTGGLLAPGQMGLVNYRAVAVGEIGLVHAAGTGVASSGLGGGAGGAGAATATAVSDAGSGKLVAVEANRALVLEAFSALFARVLLALSLALLRVCLPACIRMPACRSDAVSVVLVLGRRFFSARSAP